MGKIIISADELDLDTVQIVNKRKEEDLYLIGLPSELRLLRGIDKNIFTLTEDSPLRNVELDSLEDCIILSDKQPSFYKEIFDEDIPLSFHYKQRGLKTSSTFDTSKLIKKKHTEKCVLRVLGSELDLKKGYEEYLNKLKSHEFMTTNLDTPKLKIRDYNLLTDDLKAKVDNGYLDIGNKEVFEKVIRRYYTGTKVSVGKLLIPNNMLPNETEFDQVNYTAILFNYKFSNDFEEHLKEIVFEIKHWLNKTSINNIYVLTNDDKLTLSNLAIPKIYIKTLEER